MNYYGHLGISHTRIHTVYCGTRYLLSNTKSRIFNKEERDRVKVILSYKYVKELNTLIFDSTIPRMNHGIVRKVKVESMCIKVAPQKLFSIRD